MLSSPFWDSLIYTVPYVVAYLIGFVYLAGKWRHSTRACTLALITLAILFVVETIFLAVRLFVFWDMNAFRNHSVFLYPMNLTMTAIRSASWIALAVAVGLDRAPRRNPTDVAGPEY